MDSTDERWNSFVEVHGELLKKYNQVVELTRDVIDEVDQPDQYRDLLEEILNG